MDSMALCSLPARFLVQTRTEIGWDIASPLAGAPAATVPYRLGTCKNDTIKDQRYYQRS
jgi:hypothetical protein